MTGGRPNKDGLPSPCASAPSPGASTETQSPEAQADLVLDGLAERGFVVIPGFLRPEEFRELRRDCLQRWSEGEFRRAGVGLRGTPVIREDIRQDLVDWLEEPRLTPAQRHWWDRVERLRQRCNQQLFLGLDGYEAHFAVYPPGGFYKPHLDRHRGSPWRVVTLLLYLNEDWQPADGGQLRLYTTPGADGPEGPFVDMVPHGNTLVAFLSADFWHEVLPAGRERMSLTGWLRQRGESVF